MNLPVLQGLGWMGFLTRPIVLEQLLCAALAFALVASLRGRSPWLKRAPRLVLLLLGTGVAMALAALLGRRFGLLLFGGQILAALWALRLLEQLLLQRWLPPQAFHALVSRLLRPAFWLAVLLVVLDAVSSLRDLATISLGTWFGSQILLGTFATVVAVLYFVVAGAGFPAQAIGWLAKHTLGISDGSQRALTTLLRYGVIALGGVWALARLGIDRAGLLAVAGGLSVGLGFGVKEVFSNFISGLWLLMEGSVRPGEVLMHDGDACEVRSLDLRAATLLRARDNAELVVPNQTFFTATTTTYTRSDRMRRCSIDLNAPSSWPPETMMALLQDLAATHPGVLQNPHPVALLMGFGPTSHSYRLSFSILDPLKADSITAEVKLALWRRLDEEGLLAPASGEGSSSPAS